MVSETVRKIVGRKRTMEILELISSRGKLNFSDINDSINSSSDTVSESLEILSEHGLVKRNERSARNVQYEITPRGIDFLSTVSTLEEYVSE